MSRDEKENGQSKLNPTAQLPWKYMTYMVMKMSSESVSTLRSLMEYNTVLTGLNKPPEK